MGNNCHLAWKLCRAVIHPQSTYRTHLTLRLFAIAFCQLTTLFHVNSHRFLCKHGSCVNPIILILHTLDSLHFTVMLNGLLSSWIIMDHVWMTHKKQMTWKCLIKYTPGFCVYDCEIGLGTQSTNIADMYICCARKDPYMQCINLYTFVVCSVGGCYMYAKNMFFACSVGEMLFCDQVSAGWCHQFV